MSPDECELFPGRTKIPHPLPEEIPEGGFFSFPGAAHAPALIVDLTAPPPLPAVWGGQRGVHLGPAKPVCWPNQKTCPFPEENRWLEGVS
ncbi:MAG: hypothetical protein ACYC9S_05875 [Leptospirales bacterium]